MRAFRRSTPYDSATLLEETAKGIATGYQLPCRSDISTYVSCGDNDATLVEVLQEVAGDIYEETPPYMFTEDFSLYLRSLKGLFFFLGSGNTQKGYTYPLHMQNLDSMKRY